jgi:two-component system nitrate/nitrite response regulator NarL
MSEPIRVAAIDDHPLFRSGLRRALARARDVKLVAEGETGDDACRIAAANTADIILLDITMPGGGIDAARRIYRSGAAVKVVMLTGSDDDEHLASALSAGAAGYLLKGSTAPEILEALRAVHSGRPYITPGLSSRVLMRSVRAQPPRSSAIDIDRELTAREQQLLDYLAQGLTNREIADKLELALPTIKNSISRLFAKMHVRNRLEAVATREAG